MVDDECKGDTPETDRENEKSDNRLKVGPVAVPTNLRFFRAVDRLLAFPIEGWLETLEEKKRANTEAHVRAVLDAKRDEAPAAAKPAEPSFETMAQIQKWKVRAECYGDDEPDLAAAWRAMLDRITRKDRFADIILEALTTLSTSDLRAFLLCINESEESRLETLSQSRVASRLRMQSDGLIMRLRTLGMVKDSFQHRLTSVVGPVWSMAFLLYVASYYIRSNGLNKVIYESDFSSMKGIVDLLSLFFAFIGLLAGYVFYLQRYSLSEAGEDFVASFRKFVRSKETT